MNHKALRHLRLLQAQSIQEKAPFAGAGSAPAGRIGLEVEDQHPRCDRRRSDLGRRSW
jgi:hypothetical protein